MICQPDDVALAPWTNWKYRGMKTIETNSPATASRTTVEATANVGSRNRRTGTIGSAARVSATRRRPR